MINSVKDIQLSLNPPIHAIMPEYIEPSVWPTFMAAAVGAFIGGGISYCIALHQNYKNKINKNIVCLANIKIKFEKIISTNQHVEKYLQKLTVNNNGKKDYDLKYFFSLSFVRKDISFDDDLHILLNDKNGEFLNVYTGFEEAYRGMLSLIDTLDAKREHLHEIFSRNKNTYNKSDNTWNANIASKDQPLLEMVVDDIKELLSHVYEASVFIKNSGGIISKNHNQLIANGYRKYQALCIEHLE